MPKRLLRIYQFLSLTHSASVNSILLISSNHESRIKKVPSVYFGMWGVYQNWSLSWLVMKTRRYIGVWRSYRWLDGQCSSLQWKRLLYLRATRHESYRCCNVDECADSQMKWRIKALMSCGRRGFWIVTSFCWQHQWMSCTIQNLSDLKSGPLDQKWYEGI